MSQMVPLSYEVGGDGRWGCFGFVRAAAERGKMGTSWQSSGCRSFQLAEKISVAALAAPLQLAGGGGCDVIPRLGARPRRRSHHRRTCLGRAHRRRRSRSERGTAGRQQLFVRASAEEQRAAGETIGVVRPEPGAGVATYGLVAYAVGERGERSAERPA